MFCVAIPNFIANPQIIINESIVSVCNKMSATTTDKSAVSCSQTSNRDNSRESHNDALSSLLMLAQANDASKNESVSVNLFLA